jgi:predicted nucleic acid-binding Zn ribbon protein
MAKEPPRCPQCGSTAFSPLAGEAMICRYCGTEFDLGTDLCPHCGSLNPPGQEFCVQCGGSLVTDTVDRMLNDRLRTARQWREERQGVIRQQVAQDLLASRQRMEAFMSEEQARLERERQALAAARERERRLLIVWGVIIVVIAVLGVGLAVVISLLRARGG